MAPQPQGLNVLEECRKVLTLLQPLAEVKEIALETDFAPELPTLKADPLLFPRVLQNLIENAIKYSPSQRKVRLEVRAKDSAIELPFEIMGLGSLRLICLIYSKPSIGGNRKETPRASDWGWPRSSE